MKEKRTPPSSFDLRPNISKFYDLAKQQSYRGESGRKEALRPLLRVNHNNCLELGDFSLSPKETQEFLRQYGSEFDFKYNVK